MLHGHEPQHVHDLDQDHDRDRSHPTIASLTRASRRRLLALLAALGLVRLAGDEPAGARKPGENRHTKKRKRRKSKGNNTKRNRKRKKGNGGGGGGGSGGYSPDTEERAFLDLINDHRRQHGAGNLRLNTQLGSAADFHSRDMAKKDYFKHTLSNGDSSEENIRRFGYTNYTTVGENIAAGHQTASKVFAAWKKSNGHNQNMLDRAFDEIGIGRAKGKKDSKYGWYWTTTFGG